MRAGGYVRPVPADAELGELSHGVHDQRAESTIASGVSSTIISTPVAASGRECYDPHLPMMRPLTSSLSM